MNVLCIVAHLDDESYGPAATLSKLSAAGHSVFVLALCKGRSGDAGPKNNARTAAFNNACYDLGCTPILPSDAMDDLCLDYRWALDKIEFYVRLLSPEIVITHNSVDLHQDHKTVNSAAIVACRPKLGSPVKNLMLFESPVTLWSPEPFLSNIFVQLSDEDIATKERILKRYVTETYEYPDLRSAEGVRQLARMRGMQSGYDLAEAFQLVFSRGQIPL